VTLNFLPTVIIIIIIIIITSFTTTTTLTLRLRPCFSTHSPLCWPTRTLLAPAKTLVGIHAIRPRDRALVRHITTTINTLPPSHRPLHHRRHV
jgi:hypothetical protein